MDNRNDLDETSAERTITNAIRNDKTQPSHVRNEVVYGDTDLNPNADDQESAHRAEEDEHV